jgi:hypothetical protein
VRAAIRRVAGAAGAALALLTCAGMLGSARPPTSADPSLVPTDAPSPTVSATPTAPPTATPTPTPPCDEVLKFGQSAVSSSAQAYAPNQGIVNGTSFTNPTAFSYTDTVFEVQMIAFDLVSAHLPTVEWSWDGGAWQAISHWRDANGTNLLNLYSDRLPVGAIAAGSTHTIQFWVEYPVGATTTVNEVYLYIEPSQCNGRSIGSPRPSILFGYSTSITWGDPAASPGRPTPGAPTPSAVPSSGPSPATSAPFAAGPASQPVAQAAPSPTGHPFRIPAIVATMVLAGLAVRMGVGWWSAGRRLP